MNARPQGFKGREIILVVTSALKGRFPRDDGVF